MLFKWSSLCPGQYEFDLNADALYYMDAVGEVGPSITHHLSKIPKFQYATYMFMQLSEEDVARVQVYPKCLP